MPDGRLVRGAQTRGEVLTRSVDLASAEGLDRLSFGRLATDVGMSKSGIQTLFGSMENLQFMAIKAARSSFTRAVVDPAMHEPRGAARLRELVGRWLAYASEPLFAGGCFWAANLPAFDSRPGRIRDALVDQQREWRALLADQLTGPDADVLAFRIDAALTAANTAFRLDDDHAADIARRAVAGLVQGVS